MTLKEAYKILFEDNNEYSEIEILSRLNEVSIRRNYYELSKKYHPDYNKNNLEFANQKQKHLNEAHAILKESFKKHLETIEKTQYEVFIKKYRRSIIIKEYDFLKQNLNKICLNVNNIFELFERFELLEQYAEIMEEKESSILNLDKSIFNKEYLEKLSQENAKDFYQYLLDDEKFKEKISWLDLNKPRIEEIKKEIDNIPVPNEIFKRYLNFYLQNIPIQYNNYVVYTNNEELITLFANLQTNALSDDLKINWIKGYLSEISKLQEKYKELNECVISIKTNLHKNENITYEIAKIYFDQINKYFDEEYLLKLKNNQIKNTQQIENDNKNWMEIIENIIKESLELNLINHIENIFELVESKEFSKEKMDDFFESLKTGNYDKITNTVVTKEDKTRFSTIKQKNYEIEFYKIIELHIFYEEIVDRIKKNNPNMLDELIINNPSKYISNEKTEHQHAEKEQRKKLNKELDACFEKLICYYSEESKIDSKEFRKIYQKYVNGKNIKNIKDIAKILEDLKETYVKFQNKDNNAINQQNFSKYRDYLVEKINEIYTFITFTIGTNKDSISKESNDLISKTEETLKNPHEISLIELCNIYEELYDIYFHEINDYPEDIILEEIDNANRGTKNSR